MAEEDLTPRVTALEAWRGEASPMLAKHDAMIERLNADIVDIKLAMSGVATRDQIESLREHMDASINSLLKDALRATPQWIGLLMAAIATAASAGGIYAIFFK